METQQRITIGETAYNIVEEHAKQLVPTLVNRVIKRMREYDEEYMISNLDRGLVNLWEEYCYREQQDRGFGYEMVIDVIYSECKKVLDELKKKEPIQYKTVLLYFEVSHTNFGYEEDIEAPYSNPAEDLCSEVGSVACNYSNKRITEAIFN